MGEKGLMQDETWEEESQDEPFSDGHTIAEDGEVQKVAGDLGKTTIEDTKSSEVQPGLSKSDEASLSILFSGIEPDISPEGPFESEKKDEGPDVQDVTGDLNPDDPLTHGHMPM
ncbi:MAG TPA: hypothetical protein VLZ89_08215 [Anaerolineales bacterium]|nr:hypothetical protein [Anaerolineales bacterium]